MRSLVFLIFLLLSCALGGAAWADMWTYVDRNGVRHFSSSPVDARYSLLFRAMSAPGEAAQTDVSSPQGVQRIAKVKTLAKLEASPGYQAVKEHLHAAAQTRALDVALVQAVIAAESGFDSMAVSPKGAIGLMQVMPATAQRYGLANDATGTVAAKLTNPKTNIDTGTRYLRDLLNQYPGQLELALAAYNAGPGAVQKAGNKIPDYKETRAYVKTVLQLYRSFNPYASTTV